MRRATFLLLSVVVLTGCVSAQARFKALETGEAELEPVWQTTLETLQEQFHIAEVDRVNRRITTHFKVDPGHLGLETIPATVMGLDRFPDQVSTFRRRATARLVHRGGQYVVLLRVEKQREDTEAATALAHDDYDPTDTSRLRSFGDLPEGLPPVWTRVGGDNELRDRLLERIAQKLKGRG
ncbi:MAG: hypothetical protein KAX80_09980 [Planctomycetes bacterium]|nr:hypothetical protein [Planctomycetota bacterium]